MEAPATSRRPTLIRSSWNGKALHRRPMGPTRCRPHSAQHRSQVHHHRAHGRRRHRTDSATPAGPPPEQAHPRRPFVGIIPRRADGKSTPRALPCLRRHWPSGEHSQSKRGGLRRTTRTREGIGQYGSNNRAHRNRPTALSRLKGQPDFKPWPTLRKWSNRIEGSDRFIGGMLGFALAAPGATPADVIDWIDGQDVSGRALFNAINDVDPKSFHGEFRTPRVRDPKANTTSRHRRRSRVNSSTASRRRRRHSSLSPTSDTSRCS